MNAPDIRLIAVDMDGTLLDARGEVPEALWPLLKRLEARGIAFAPASGRQLATLQRSFERAGIELDYIAENGAYVVRGDEEISSDALDLDFVHTVVTRIRQLGADGTHNLGVVVCGKRSAYIERADEVFGAEAHKYYAKLQVVSDVLATDDQILKIAIYDFADAETSTAPEFADLRDTHQVVVSGAHWVDIMNQGVNKGVALEALQRALGVTREQTAAFGDYLNDIELLQQAEWSYAMADAHPDVVAVANHRAPSFRDHGVITVIEQLLS